MTVWGELGVGEYLAVVAKEAMFESLVGAVDVIDRLKRVVGSLVGDAN